MPSRNVEELFEKFLDLDDFHNLISSSLSTHRAYVSGKNFHEDL